MANIDVEDLRDKVKAMYQAVADEPHGTFHFEMGYELAARLGYPKADLDATPPEAIESFAGVGHHLGLAALHDGDRVVDLGSGSGMDAFLAARRVGDSGTVTGVDMTDAQLAASTPCPASEPNQTPKLPDHLHRALFERHNRAVFDRRRQAQSCRIAPTSSIPEVTIGVVPTRSIDDSSDTEAVACASTPIVT